MKKKISFVVVLIAILGVYLVSLPEKQNFRLRNALANALAEELSRCTLIETWFERGEKKRHIAQEVAKRRSSGNYVVAKVVFRPLGTYTSCFWIEGGKEHPLIKKNSPVLYGDALVGVVEYVGDKASLVRLITDSAVCPSVRVARGVSDTRLLSSLRQIRKLLEQRRISSLSQEEEELFLKLIEKIESASKPGNASLFLAKGILQGYGESLWRSPYPLLKGSEFNYDFKDAYGPARDLRTGIAYDPKEEYPPQEAKPLVLVGDLLVTTGMDGVFPEGLKVAYVSSIFPLTEGSYSYDLIASPACDELLDLEYVTIIPPLEFDFSQIPHRIDKVLDQL